MVGFQTSGTKDFFFTVFNCANTRNFFVALHNTINWLKTGEKFRRFFFFLFIINWLKTGEKFRRFFFFLFIREGLGFMELYLYLLFVGCVVFVNLNLSTLVLLFFVESLLAFEVFLHLRLCFFFEHRISN
jgi:hypothetical protein